MSDIKTKIQEELDELKRLRDEVKVQAKLGEAEAKKLWERVEGQWPEVERRFKTFEAEFDEASREAVSKIMGATRDLYEDIKRRFGSD